MSESILNKTYSLKNDTSFTIRETQPEDAAAMIQLALAILNSTEYSLTSPDEFQYTEEEEIKLVETYQKEPGYIYLLAEQDGQLIGMINFWNGKKRKNKHSGEFAMGVHPDFRNLGVGTHLLETLIGWAEKNELISKVNLGVFFTNSDAIHLYKNLGFREEGRKRKEIRTDDGEYVDLVLMCKFV